LYHNDPKFLKDQHAPKLADPQRYFKDSYIGDDIIVCVGEYQEPWIYAWLGGFSRVDCSGSALHCLD